MTNSQDIIIIGTGVGGGTLARALAGSGARIIVLERGDYLPREAENWSPEAVFLNNRYKSPEVWEDASGRPFHPGVHYFVGGNTKVFGAVLHRLRVRDFEAIEHEGGTSPAWPITYDDLEPYYAIAERWYDVHGSAGEDPTEPPRSSPFPFPAMPHDDYMAELRDAFRGQGLRPYSLPIGVDWRDGGSCIRCRTCDAFPCQLGAKCDAERCGIKPALAFPNVELMTNAIARRLLIDPSGRQITGVEIERNGERVVVSAGTYVLSCGAVNSAALLLRSGAGLANGSGLVGRNYMVHNNAVLVAVHPTKKNPTVFQKSLALNDFYFSGPNFPYPLGNLQPIGKLQAAMMANSAPHVPKALLGAVAARSTDWWVMTEDLPDPENRVTLTSNGGIRVHWKPNNEVAHRRLLAEAKSIFREAGYPILLDQTMGIETNSHQVGTLKFGNDPATSVLDSFCKAHEIDNLFVVDASFFPSSSAMNPALTIAAQAVRVAEHLTNRPVLA
jgi:choline dehydrogenase-like flavoprotein